MAFRLGVGVGYRSDISIGGGELEKLMRHFFAATDKDYTELTWRDSKRLQHADIK